MIDQTVTPLPGDTVMELSYWEALRAYWRIYWPAQAAGAGLLLAMSAFRLRTAPLNMAALQGVIGAAALFLLVSRLYSFPYRGFSLVILDPAGNPAAQRLSLRQRGQAWWFLWWRQLAAGVIAGFLAMPANIVLGIMGLHLARWIAVLAVVLVIGPILLKMLIGNTFDTFRIEARLVG